MPLDLHLIGGCGSSGSATLAHLLDGLHDLHVGPESGAFHHRALYDDAEFERALYAALTGRAIGADVSIGDLSLALVPTAFLLEREWYGMEGIEAELELLRSCVNAEQLFGVLKERMARARGLSSSFGWIDQTPKNCVAADVFLERVPDGRFVHVVRDGRDVMAALAQRMARWAPGHAPDAYLTLGLVDWVHDVACGRRAESHPGYMLVRYEELVSEPLMVINRVLRHLARPEVEPEELAASAAAADTEVGIGSWRTELPGDALEGALAFRFTPPGWERELGFAETLEALGY